MASAGVRKAILLAHPQLLGLSAASIWQRMLYFCSKYKSQERDQFRRVDGIWSWVYSRETKLWTKALEHGIPLVPEATMRSRAAELQPMLRWQDFQLKQAVKNCPGLLTCPSATMAQNVLKLRERHQRYTEHGIESGHFAMEADCSFSVRELLHITD